MTKKIAVVIPARYESTRLPGKPLADINGKSMIQHVYEKAKDSMIERVIVATDDERVKRAVEAFGGEAVMTSSDHESGSDRIVEAIADTDADIVINVQGDEPMLDPEYIRKVVIPVLTDKKAQVATLACPFDDPKAMKDPNEVKVVLDRKDYALYFSRSAIPYIRDPNQGDPLVSACLKHIGIYAYKREFLDLFPTLRRGTLEAMESLEQLRVLEHGYKIKVMKVDKPTIGVDTQDDLERVRLLMGRVGSKK